MAMTDSERIRETYRLLYLGLEARGFGPFGGKECSRGGCHTADKRHYILLTDGMVIYSTMPHWDDKVPGSLSMCWHADEFRFDELDYLMAEKA